MLIEQVLKAQGIDRKDVPVVSEYQHYRILGATRAISCILHDLRKLGVVYSTASGASEEDDQLHTHDWFLAYETKKDDNPPPAGEKGD